MKKSSLINKTYLFILLSLFSNFSIIYAQEKGNIKGYVIDPNEIPIPMVNVIIMGTGQGTTTDSTGYFEVSVNPDRKYTLKLSHISYEDFYRKKIIAKPGQTIDLGMICLFPEVLQGESLVITATKIPKSRYELAAPVNIITKDDVKERNSKTTSESLREETGVFVQKTNHGGGSAILRGLGSNQILILVDGIRLNNSTYRLGNHQYLTTVDNNIAEKVEVVRGPTSMLYGSDAMGGTINVITEKHYPTGEKGKPEINFSFSGRNSTADNEKFARGQLSIVSEKLSFHSGISYKDFGDLKRGKNSTHTSLENSTNGLYQSPSGFSQLDYDSKLIYSPSRERSFILAYQKTDQGEVPRYDKYENNNYYRWIYTPQKRSLLYMVFEENNPAAFIRNTKISLSFQQQEEGRETQKDFVSDLTIENDDVKTLGLTLSFYSKHRSHELNYGAEIYLDKVKSRRIFRNSLFGIFERADVRGRYIDGSRYNSFGFYFEDEYSLKNNISTTAGVRLSSFYARFNVPDNPAISVFGGETTQKFSSLTGSLGILYRLTEGVNLSMNLGQAFRAPNLSDLSKLGESKGETYEIPNLNLDPEKLTNLEAGIKLNMDKLKGDAYIYYSSINNLIASADDLYNGSSIIEIGDVDYRVKSKQNIGCAYIKGFEASIRYSYNDNYSIYSNLTYTYGQNTTLNEPVGSIPPIFGLAGLKYSRETYFINFFMRFASKQDRLSSDDLDDPRIPEGGTPAWHTFNIRYGKNLKKHIFLRLSLENILDLNYREHGSGINGPGRNFIFSIEYEN
ncbi:TonB-dependent receptor domain-containing protein [candidate division KSB1 bacterium]